MSLYPSFMFSGLSERECAMMDLYHSSVGVVGSITQAWQRLFCNTSPHFHLSRHCKKQSLWADMPLPPPFFFKGGIHKGIFFFTLNHCHDRIPYAGKAKRQTHVFILGYILPHCKSSFFRKCEIKQTYCVKLYNALHISSRRLETHELHTKTTVSLQCDFVTLTYVPVPSIVRSPEAITP